jgi:hypothetical protein
MPARAPRRKLCRMDTTGYIVNIALVLLVVRQIRERRLDLRSLVLPVALVALVATQYLHSVPTVGNDTILELVLAASGAVMGALGALTTHVRLGADGVALGRAGLAAAGLWIAGVGGRLAFAVAAAHGLGPAIGSFSVHHDISGPQAWVAALVLMAFADVGTRLVVLHLRGRRLERRAVAVLV